MSDAERWRELGQQLRVDAVRASAKAGSGHPTSSMSAADLAAVLARRAPPLRLRPPARPAQRPPGLLEGPRVAARLRALPRRGRDLRGGVHDLPAVRQPPPGAPDAGPALGGRRNRLARPGAADRRRHGARRQAARPAPVPRLGDLRRQRDGRGLDVGGVRARGVLRARQPDRDHRRQPARTARRDDARLGPRLVHAAAARRSAGTRSRSTATTSRRSTGRTPRRSGRRASRPRSSPRRSRARATRRSRTRAAGTARRLQGRGRGGRRGDGRRAQHRRGRPEARAGRAAPLRARPASSSRAYEVGVGGGDAQGLRRRARVRSAPRTGDVVALDGEVSNSTYAEIFGKAHPERFFEMYIAEQQMVAAAVGLQVLGWKPFASTFAAFMRRAYDFVRMAAISRANLRLCGSHAGVSIGEDGPSQMALEDLAAFRAVQGCTVLYPCDGNQTAQLVAADGRPRRDLVPAHDRARTRACSTGPTRSSRSAAARSCAPRTRTT